ncbi:NAD(P)H-dependent oxidoreductase [Streptococcus sp. zg-JUN1979]|uniref:NAD(P)H-dependent oxidoreductase n=1 Tax=Streptococcus sp. zg-JUN1979 TaxID=3391450 RepID=UPI0039A5CB84
MTKSLSKDLLKEIYQDRVSIRRYNDKAIPKSDMDFILDAAWQSPSSIGLEPWRFIVLDRPSIKKLAKELKDVSWGAVPQLESASHFVLLLAQKEVAYDSENVKDSLERRGLDESQIAERLKRYKTFQTTDMGISADKRYLWDWASKQTYIALANMISTARLIGIDSCPIEGFNYAKVNTILANHQLINPDKEAISCMVSFGYRKHNPKHPRHKKERNTVISWVNSNQL